MKKSYIQPAMETEWLGTQLTLLSGSFGVHSGESNAVGEGQVLSPRLNDMDDDEDDEDEEEY